MADVAGSATPVLTSFNAPNLRSMASPARQLSNAVSLPRTSGSTAMALGSHEALNIETALQGRPVYPIRVAISAESIVPVSFDSAGSQKLSLSADSLPSTRVQECAHCATSAYNMRRYSCLVLPAYMTNSQLPCHCLHNIQVGSELLWQDIQLQQCAGANPCYSTTEQPIWYVCRLSCLQSR